MRTFYAAWSSKFDLALNLLLQHVSIPDHFFSCTHFQPIVKRFNYGLLKMSENGLTFDFYHQSDFSLARN